MPHLHGYDGFCQSGFTGGLLGGGVREGIGDVSDSRLGVEVTFQSGEGEFHCGAPKRYNIQLTATAVITEITMVR